MKTLSLASLKNSLAGLLILTSSFMAFSQDDDGIYGDIFETPEYDIEEVDTASSPLDGYSTVDEYYPEEGYANESETEQYTDEEGNTYITNNYYGDDDDEDYAYAARINRFHRPIRSYSYYDSYYTNMYWYTYDPYYYGTSIYVNGWSPYSSFYWNPWNSWNFGWGWNSPYYSPYCYGNGWNNGYGSYWNGYNDGVAYGGYYNTYDSNSGIYYGPRSSEGNSGSGFRSNTIGAVYNKAAADGVVSHENKGNYLQTASAERVIANKPLSSIDAVSRTSLAVKDQSVSRTNAVANREVATETTTRTNPYQRSETARNGNVPNRTKPATTARNRSVTPTRTPMSAARANVYQRGNVATRQENRKQVKTPTENRSRGNKYQDAQRTQPNSGTYNRTNPSNSNRYKQPTRPNSPSRSNDNYSRPSNTRPNNQAPSRNYSKPSTPSRGSSPSRSVKPNRGSSSNSSSSPSRSSGSNFKSNSGGSSSGSKSRGGGRK